jgi:peptide deformylase
MTRPIVAYGDPVLTQPALPVESAGEDLWQLIQDMFDTMQAAEGVGLAAPQVGEGLSVFVTAFAEDVDPFFLKQSRWPGRVFINPKLLDSSGLMATGVEGCLSIPGIEVSVQRPMQVRINYRDEQFNLQEESFTGFMARVVQHEMDHLDGILMTDRINRHRQKSLKPHLSAVARGKHKAGYAIHYPTN